MSSWFDEHILRKEEVLDVKHNVYKENHETTMLNARKLIEYALKMKERSH